MKKILIFLFIAVLAMSCGVSRKVSREANLSWVGRPTLEIIQRMGNPDRIEGDGKDGSILRYEAKPNYEDPSYDILDPNAKPDEGGYAYFYVDREGECYFVDTDRKLPRPDYGYYDDDGDDGSSVWVNVVFYLSMLLIGLVF